MFFELVLLVNAVVLGVLVVVIGDLTRELRAWRKLSTTRREEHLTRLNPEDPS